MVMTKIMSAAEFKAKCLDVLDTMRPARLIPLMPR